MVKTVRFFRGKNLTQFTEKVRIGGDWVLFAMGQGLAFFKPKLEVILGAEENLSPVVLSQASLLAYAFLQGGGRNCAPFR